MSIKHQEGFGYVEIKGRAHTQQEQQEQRHRGNKHGAKQGVQMAGM
jgi:hypothetical protein